MTNLEELTYLLNLQSEACHWTVTDDDNAYECEVKLRIKQCLEKIPDDEKTPLSKVNDILFPNERHASAQKRASARFARKKRLIDHMNRHGYTYEEEMIDNENTWKVFKDGKYIARTSPYNSIAEFRQLIDFLPKES